MGIVYYHLGIQSDLVRLTQSLDGPCDSHGQLPHPTSAPIWGTCAGTKNPRAAKEALQRLRQGKPEVRVHCCGRGGTERPGQSWLADSNQQGLQEV